MAKKSAIDKNKKRIQTVEQQKDKRAALKKTIKDKNVSQEDRFKAVLKLASLPKNGSKIRVRNRCEVTGRPRGNYRKFGMSRIAFRDLAKKEGFIRGYTVNKDNEKKPLLVIELKYFEGKPAIKEIKRASRPGLRLYSSKKDMPLNYGGLGISIVSTSKGLMSDHDARNANIGGEILCSVF